MDTAEKVKYGYNLTPKSNQIKSQPWLMHKNNRLLSYSGMNSNSHFTGTTAIKSKDPRGSEQSEVQEQDDTGFSKSKETTIKNKSGEFNNYNLAEYKMNPNSYKYNSKNFY